MAWWSIIAKSFLNVTLSWRYSSGLQSADLNPIQHRWDVVGQEVCTIKVPIGRNSVTALPQFGPTSRRKISSTCCCTPRKVLKAEGGLTFDLWVYLIYGGYQVYICVCIFSQVSKSLLKSKHSLFARDTETKASTRRCVLFVSISSGASSLGQFGDDPD